MGKWNNTIAQIKNKEIKVQRLLLQDIKIKSGLCRNLLMDLVMTKKDRGKLWDRTRLVFKFKGRRK